MKKNVQKPTRRRREARPPTKGRPDGSLVVVWARLPQFHVFEAISEPLALGAAQAVVDTWRRNVAGVELVCCSAGKGGPNEGGPDG